MNENINAGSAMLAGTPSVDSPGAISQGGASDAIAQTQSQPQPQPALTDSTIKAPETWYSGIQNEDLRGYAELRNWKSVDDAVESYRNLEKFLGADKAGRGLVLPGEDATPDAWNEVFTKLGKPATPDDYKLEVPEGQPAEFAKNASSWMHEANLTTQQAQALSAKWNEYITAQNLAQQEALTKAIEADQAELQREWGKDYHRRVDLAQRAKRGAGVSDDEVVKILSAIGEKRMTEIFYNFGQGLSEDSFVAANDMNSGMSRSAALSRLEEMKKDTAFMQKLFNNDILAKEEFHRLHRHAYGE